MSEKRKTTIFTVCYLAYTLIYVARLNLSVSSTCFIEAQILDSAGIGLLGGVFSVIYAFSRLINGYISDNISPRRMIGVGLLIVGISNICMGLLPGIAGVVVLWGLNAFGQSMLWGPILRIVANTYDEQTAKKITSYMVSVFAFALCVISAAVLCIGTVPPAVAAICLSLLYAGASIANTSILSIFPLQFAESDNVASVSGIMDFATYFGAGVSSFIYGNAINALGYTPMFLSWAIIPVISIIVLRPLITKGP